MAFYPPPRHPTGPDDAIILLGSMRRRPKRGDDWLPADAHVQARWLNWQLEQVDAKLAFHAPFLKPLAPPIYALQKLIESSPRIYMYFTRMFTEIPAREHYRTDPTGLARQIRDYPHLLRVLDHIFAKAPEWTNAAAGVGLVGVPICAVLDYAMGTPSGRAAFLDPEVNMAFRRILNAWGEQLRSPESAEVLGTGPTHWFGEHGLRELLRVANEPYGTRLRFENIYVCDPTQRHYGFKSWDDFFTRRIWPAVRPVAAPDDDLVVANCCESRVFNVSRNCSLRTHFWIKAQPYSVLDMLGHSTLAVLYFDGATIYQAFLSALSYHRWHSPVTGTILRCLVIPGTYFSEPPFVEASGPRGEMDPDGLDVAQGYLTSMATRAVIFIQADHPAIGLLAFVGVGMDEVSTCEITVVEGQRVDKGDELGMFHYGGSSHCVLFRKEVIVEDFPPVASQVNVAVRSRLCVVRDTVMEAIVSS